LYGIVLPHGTHGVLIVDETKDIDWTFYGDDGVTRQRNSTKIIAIVVNNHNNNIGVWSSTGLYRILHL
jgi:hypothetical protein